MNLVQQVLNSDNFAQDIYTRKVSNDINNDLKIINVNDMLKKTL